MTICHGSPRKWIQSLLFLSFPNSSEWQLHSQKVEGIHDRFLYLTSNTQCISLSCWFSPPPIAEIQRLLLTAVTITLAQDNFFRCPHLNSSCLAGLPGPTSALSLPVLDSSSSSQHDPLKAKSSQFSAQNPLCDGCPSHWGLKIKDPAHFSVVCLLPVTLAHSLPQFSPPLPWLTHTLSAPTMETDFFACHLRAFASGVPSAWSVLHGFPTSSCLCSNVPGGFLWLSWKNRLYHSLAPSLSSVFFRALIMTWYVTCLFSIYHCPHPQPWV